MRTSASFYPWYVAAVLACAYAVAFVDRQILNLLIDPIKADFGLTDTRMSLLQGMAFVVAYVCMAPVFGRFADQRSRRNLLVIGVTVWCICTVFCGFSRDFWTLFAARAGIGAAEACLLPAGWSLLADCFDRERLPRGMSIFLLGPFIGGGLALIFGGLVVRQVTGMQFEGLLAGLQPWQLTFVFVGAPGVLIALLLLTVREPERRLSVEQVRERFSIGDVIRFFWSDRDFYGRFFGGMALLIVALYALPAWTPSFLSRAFGVPTSRVGIEYGTAALFAGTLGVLLGPSLTRWLARFDPARAKLRTAVVAAAATAPGCLFLPFAHDYMAALLASASATFALNLALPSVAAALQESTPNRMRGVATSIYTFVVMTAGLALAPTLIAMTTDQILRDSARIGVALGWVCGIAALAALPLLAGAARLGAKSAQVAAGNAD